MSFEGFSDADIIKLTQDKSAVKDVSSNKVATATKHKKVTFKLNRPHHNQNKVLLNENIKLDDVELPETAKLQVDKPPCEPKVDTTHQQNGEIVKKLDEKSHENEPVNFNNDVKSTKKDLRELQTRQKLMEEQNRKRKELLAKALADRTKRTQEEAQRLNEIQIELRKLDATLSNDVKILRKQIDLASVDYMEAQKRYLKIEKEFLEAKLYLQQKLEKKEMLTEHLCAIIGKNEERKGKKLTELLEKLKLDPKAVEGDTVVQNNEVSTSETTKQ